MLVETQYFPCNLFWAEAYKKNKDTPKIIIESHENYQKRSYRNKCNILAANGILTLSVPLEKGKNSGMPIRDVKISYVDSWQSIHLQSIRSAYGSAPYFEFYWDHIEKIISEKHVFLYDLNMSALQYFSKLLKIELAESTSFKKEIEGTDFRQKLKPSLIFTLPEYAQVFEEKHTFQSNLSFLDLLFCEGPAASLYLKKLSALEI